jgi:biopolymer transport protein ExbD
MGLSTRNKVSPAFNMSSMTDIVFLLLIFFMLTSTLVAPNALKLLLPRSNNQTQASPIVSVSITEDLRYYIKTEEVPFENLERILKNKLQGEEEPTISLHAERTVPIDEVVKVMNIAKNNKFRLILATQPK